MVGTLLESGRPRLLRLTGEQVAPLPGWPAGRPVRGLVVRDGILYGLLGEPDGTSVWRSDGHDSVRVVPPRDDWQPTALTAAADGLWATGTGPEGGTVWHSPDGAAWAAVYRLAGGVPLTLAHTGGAVYVGGEGADGRGILWGPAAPTGALGAVGGGALPEPSRASAPDWDEAGLALDAALAEPASYAHHGAALRDRLYALARAGPPADFFTRRLDRPLPHHPLSLIGGKVVVPAERLGRWLLLWAMTVSGSGRVPPALIATPWTAPANPSAKYFELAPAAMRAAAMRAAAMLGQRDRATVDALVARLGRPDDPPWLDGDAIGALAAVTGEAIGHDAAAWRRWWRVARPDWPG